MDTTKPKRALFKRPTWAADTVKKTDTSLSVDDVDTPTLNLFDRSKDYGNIVAERERRRRARSDKKKANKEEDKHRHQDSPEPRPNHKRRRISDQNDHDDADNDPRPIVSDTKTSTREKSESFISQQYDDAPIVTKPQTQPANHAHGDKSTVVELDSDDDENSDDDGPLSPSPEPLAMSPPAKSHAPSRPSALPAPQVTTGAPQYPSESDSESDPELVELKRKAREKRRLAEQQQGEHGHAQISASVQDPVVQILVTSPIPNTTPLIVSRRLSQRLQEVKEAWFARQGFPPDFTPSQVFFTYRLTKLYDVTACKSLGIKVDSQGKIIPDNKGYLDDDETALGGEHEGKIHLEAMTEELYHKMRAAKRTGRNGSSVSNTRGTERPDAEGTPMESGDHRSDKEPIVRITLTAKGFKEVKIKVKPVSLSRPHPLYNLLTIHIEHSLLQDRKCREKDVRQAETRPHRSATDPILRWRTPRAPRRSGQRFRNRRQG